MEAQRSHQEEAGVQKHKDKNGQVKEDSECCILQQRGNDLLVWFVSGCGDLEEAFAATDAWRGPAGGEGESVGSEGGRREHRAAAPARHGVKQELQCSRAPPRHLQPKLCSDLVSIISTRAEMKQRVPHGCILYKLPVNYVQPLVWFIEVKHKAKH